MSKQRKKRRCSGKASPSQRKAQQSSARSCQCPDIGDELARAVDFQRSGDIQSAEAGYRSVLKSDPRHPDALHLMGMIASQKGDFESAVRLIREAIKQFPGSDIFFNNLGNALARLNRIDEALSAYREALRINPDSVEALNNLATNLKESGRTQEALGYFRKALTINPQAVEIYNNMGNALTDLGQIDAAVNCFNKAIALKPDYALAHNNLGSALKLRDRFKEAIESYIQSVNADPGYAEAYNNIGETLADMGKPDEAISFFDKAIELKPDFGLATGNLLYALTRLCAWNRFADFPQRLDCHTQQAIKKEKLPPEDPFFNLVRHDNPSVNQQIARAWCRPVSRKAKTDNRPFDFDHRRSQDGSRLTIGYLSNNYHDHPMAHLLAGLIDSHDRQCFEINCYSCGPDDEGEYRRRIQQRCNRFIDLRRLDHWAAAQRINHDQVDILVDLMGHTKGHRLDISALRPSPVQVRYLGMAGTTGGDFFDYLIADHTVIPPAHAAFYNEKIVYLPHTYQVNDYRQQGLPAKMGRRLAGLPEDRFVFCSFNQTYKLDPVLFDTWMRVLTRVTGSILWLQCSNPGAEANLKHAAEERGVDAHRIVFGPRMAKREHLARLQLADLALDTIVVNGAATTTDALWAGVPVITMKGGHFASRMSSSLLNAVGLPQLVTGGLEDYEKLAVQLALQPERLSIIRQKLQSDRYTAPLFDTQRFTRNLEKAYRRVWQRFSNSQEPQQIIVDDPDPSVNVMSEALGG